MTLRLWRPTPAPVSPARLAGTAALAMVIGLLAHRPAAAQVPVMAQPTSYATWNNKTNAYQVGSAIYYSKAGDAYGMAKTVQGVPNNIYSYIVTQGEPGGNGLDVLLSTVGIPAVGAAPAIPLNLTLPAGASNTSLGGLMDAFRWGAVNVVMNQCFGGGFAFNIQGSLQGARPAAGGAVIPAPNPIGYTFASGANYSEVGYGMLLPSQSSDPGTATAGADFTQGWAYGSTNTAVPPAPPNSFSVYDSYDLGKRRDPFVAGTAPYDVANQVGNLQAGGFESPVYASPDAPLAGPPAAVNPAAANNSRTLATNAANGWAILLAMTPDRSEFSLDIQRQYAALISNGVSRGHIAVLYGNDTNGSLARFTNLTAANNKPDVNAILNTIAANFQVPVNGVASKANIAGLLNPAIIQNPGDPIIAQKNYWQYLLRTDPGGASPAAGDSLFFYMTGHGSAVDVFGGDVTAANQRNGNVFKTTIKLAGPGNVTITPGENKTAQIATRAPLFNLGSVTFSVNGLPIGFATPATLVVDAFDVSQAIDESAVGPFYFYNITIPEDAMILDADGRFTLSVSSADTQAIESLDRSIYSITLMDGPPDACAFGLCDMYTDVVTAPAVPVPAMGIPGLVIFIALLAGAAICVLAKRNFVQSY